MPHPLIELSMTRHREATEAELWDEGRRVGAIRNTALHGRADVAVEAFEAAGLNVVAKPIADNSNHADAINWPSEKPAQKIMAILVANKSKYLAAGAGT